MTDLSGRVQTLESSFTFLNQQLLRKPELEDIRAYSITWNSQFSQLNTTVTQMRAQLNTIQNLLINLNITMSDHWASFTGHTGLSTGGNPRAHP